MPHAPGASAIWTTSVTAPDGSTTTYVYAGNTLTVADPAGMWKKCTNDAFGNLVEVVKHPMAEALCYVLGQCEKLNVFCRDGAVPINNQISEREMKRVVQARSFSADRAVSAWRTARHEPRVLSGVRRSLPRLTRWERVPNALSQKQDTEISQIFVHLSMVSLEALPEIYGEAYGHMEW